MTGPTASTAPFPDLTHRTVAQVDGMAKRAAVLARIDRRDGLAGHRVERAA